MTAELHVDYDVHLRSGRVWRVELELPVEGEPYCIRMTVDVVAPNRDLAQYVAATIYPEYISLCIDDEPLSPTNPTV